MINAEWKLRRDQQASRRQGDHRSAFQRDKARILHSAAFRRLQSKTQVLGIGNGDFHRTRLTHSIEAAQIGHGIGSQLQIKYPELTSLLDLQPILLETLCLAHDIGHPPFGHGGEIALHYMMHQHGGFEGNGQTFRIVTKLEPYTRSHGMNLSRRSVLGLLKYPNYLDLLEKQNANEFSNKASKIQAHQWHPPKGIYRDDSAVFEWVLAPLSEADKQQFISLSRTASNEQHGKTHYKSFDCSIMELADDIAYGIHDLEDAIVMGIIAERQFQEEVLEPIKTAQNTPLSEMIADLSNKLFSVEHFERKDAIGAVVNYFVSRITISETAGGFAEPLLKYNAFLPTEDKQNLQFFKTFVHKRVINKPEIQQVEYKGQQMVIALFNAFSADPLRLLPENTRNRWQLAESEGNGNRIIADYISGMTDEFASRMYGTLFLPK